MKDARVGEEIVQACPDAPKEGVCPICGGRVTLRHRTDSDTYFYRHVRGEGKYCPRRPYIVGGE